MLVAPDNVTMHRGQVSIVQRLKVLKREALRSGKIKIDKVRSEIYSAGVSNHHNGGDVLDIDQWERFQNGAPFEWEEFTAQESRLRKT